MILFVKTVTRKETRKQGGKTQARDLRGFLAGGSSQTEVTTNLDSKSGFHVSVNWSFCGANTDSG